MRSKLTTSDTFAISTSTFIPLEPIAANDNYKIEVYAVAREVGTPTKSRALNVTMLVGEDGAGNAYIDYYSPANGGQNQFMTAGYGVANPPYSIVAVPNTGMTDFGIDVVFSTPTAIEIDVEWTVTRF